MSRAFHWDSHQIDEMEIELFFDYLVVSAMDRKETKKPKRKYIDEIF